MNIENFKKDLTYLINKHSLENDSNTPDFVLAEYLVGCLESYNKSIKLKDGFYNKSTDNKKMSCDIPF